jgi:hypothetical protein
LHLPKSRINREYPEFTDWAGAALDTTTSISKTRQLADGRTWAGFSFNLATAFVVVMAAGYFFDLAHASQPSDAYPTSDDLDSIDPNLSTPDEKHSPNQEQTAAAKPVDMAIAGLQVLLDREGFSPGAINGIGTAHFDRMLRLYEQRNALSSLTDDPSLVSQQLANTGGEAFIDYTISADDIAGPFLPDLPKRIQDQSGFEELHFLSVEEALAERFHMDEAFLKLLNPGAEFLQPGTVLKVANFGRYLDRWVARIHADKSLRQLTAYDVTGRILAVYPASIGSRQTPSPKGVFKVRNKAGFPAYTLASV